MEMLLIIVLIAMGLYFLTKFALWIYRPFGLAKILCDIQLKYENLLRILEKDVEEAVDGLRKWESGDRVIRGIRNEKELKEEVSNAYERKTHEQRVNEKFIRLRERFADNPKKLSEAIIAYKRYLELKLKHGGNAFSAVSALTSGAISFDEFQSAANEGKIVIEECERRLDLLLEEKG